MKPRLIVVLENSSVVVTDNTIIGGGVAGVMVQGTATILGNHFKGNGPPTFAAWIQGGSNVLFSNNRTDRWRHALFPSGANRVWATDNTVSNFLGTSIVVNKSILPAHVFGNIALSESENGKAVSVNGPQGVIGANTLKKPASPKETENIKTPDGG